MNIYNLNETIVDRKADNSPLTKADLNSNAKIIDELKSSGIPVISEEIKNVAYDSRKDWDRCWIIDPMDGTKEFVNRNGEFTVNIALLENGRLIMGIIYAPVLHILYFTDDEMNKSYKCKVDWQDEVNLDLIKKTSETLQPIKDQMSLKIVASKSHMNDETKNYINKLSSTDERQLEIVSVGSSLKFCLVAEGSAEVYPRFGPTMEWDTAAGQAICEAAGIEVISVQKKLPLQYNKGDLYNPFFIVR